jgi:hypothetical protein
MGSPTDIQRCPGHIRSSPIIRHSRATHARRLWVSNGQNPMSASRPLCTRWRTHRRHCAKSRFRAISGLNRPGCVVVSRAVAASNLRRSRLRRCGKPFLVCSSVALAMGLIIAMGIATYALRLAARNTPSGSPRFLALPVLTLPCNRAKSSQIVPTATASAAIRR